MVVHRSPSSRPLVSASPLWAGRPANRPSRSLIAASHTAQRQQFAADRARNVAKLNLATGRVSLLAYEEFFAATFPELQASWGGSSRDAPPDCDLMRLRAGTRVSPGRTARYSGRRQPRVRDQRHRGSCGAGVGALLRASPAQKMPSVHVSLGPQRSALAYEMRATSRGTLISTAFKTCSGPTDHPVRLEVDTHAFAYKNANVWTPGSQTLYQTLPSRTSSQRYEASKRGANTTCPCALCGSCHSCSVSRTTICSRSCGRSEL